MSREIEQDSDSFVRSLNPEVQTLERIVGEIAGTGIPVLLAGESGTGKEVFALEIHRQSARRDEPLVKIRCASLEADSLLGWLQPAASSGNGGESAGTVFFDEVSKLDAACQRYLLQVLPDGDGFPRKPFLAARTIFSTLVARGSAKNKSPGTEESAGAPRSTKRRIRRGNGDRYPTAGSNRYRATPPLPVQGHPWCSRKSVVRWRDRSPP